MTAYDLLIGPFAEFAFMRRALAGCFALSVGAAPAGLFLVLRRMSLMGDAMAHAVLPGAALGFLAAGMSLGAMSAGGIAAGLAVALLAGLSTRLTPMREDAALAGFYLISLALGVLIVSLRGSSVDLLHVLFGTVLALDDHALLLLGAVATVTLLFFAIAWRPLLLECVDPGFLRAAGDASGSLVHLGFLAAVVLNLVAGFQALGTLMAVGLMMLPAASARFWAHTAHAQVLVALAASLGASVAGLLASFHAGLPSGPAIVLAAGLGWLLSIIAGPRGGLLPRLRPGRHLEA